MTRNWLSAQQAPHAARALAAAEELERSAPIAAALDELLGTALASADIASLLIEARAACAYILLVPNRYEGAATIRKYPAFAGGWCAHLATLRDSVAKGGGPAKLIAFAFFVDPDGGDSTLLLSFADDSGLHVPASLRDAHAAPGPIETLDLSREFRLAA